ncbi:hypothetical protein [Escherichia phage UPEC01]|nr:hypothetical protein [Escherichia phage UPEC01]
MICFNKNALLLISTLYYQRFFPQRIFHNSMCY